MTDEAVDLWFRNPHLYIKECLEVGVRKFSWARKYLVHKGIDPMKYIQLHYGKGNHFEFLICDEMGTQHWSSEYPKDPIAVYPTWVYGDDISLLEELCQYSPGDDPDACNDDRFPRHFLPVEGQDHKIVIVGAPSAGTGLGRKFFQVLSDIQSDYPEVVIHLHNSLSYNIMFGTTLKSVDYDGRHYALSRKLHLPNGKTVDADKVESVAPWVSLLGYTPGELEVPRIRCMFNMKSAMWAAKYFKNEVRFKHKRDGTPVDAETPDGKYKIPTTRSTVFLKKVTPKEGDKFLCDSCSLQLDCRYFRTGAVCVVPDAEPKELAAYFKTRDSHTIIEGLGTVLAAQAHRMNRGLQKEVDSDDGKLDPEVTKVINSLFDRAEKLAKLVDPTLRGGPKIQFNQQNIATGSPQQLMAGIIAELEARGVAREDITPEMIEGVLSTKNPQAAIEATATE